VYPPGAVVTKAFPLELADAKFCVSVEDVGDMEVDELVVIVVEEIVALVGLLVLMDKSDDIVVTMEDEATLNELVLIIDDEAWEGEEVRLIVDRLDEGELNS
jgi:hypothetical protein